MKYRVPEMSCSHYTAAIGKDVMAKDPAADIATDLETRLVSVVSTLPQADGRQAIAGSGYAATTA